MRYVVVAMCDDAARVYGPYREYEKAQAFADKLNAAVDRAEAKEWKAYNARPWSEDDLAPHIPSHAHVRIVHTPRIREASRWLLEGVTP